MSQHDDLCVRSSSVDYYSLEGVDTMSPQGMDGECDTGTSLDVFSTYRFCDANGQYTGHFFHIPVNLTELGLPEGASAADVELLFSTGSLSGIYELSDQFSSARAVGCM